MLFAFVSVFGSKVCANVFLMAVCSDEARVLATQAGAVQLLVEALKTHSDNVDIATWIYYALGKAFALNRECSFACLVLWVKLYFKILDLVSASR